MISHTPSIVKLDAWSGMNEWETRRETISVGVPASVRSVITSLLWRFMSFSLVRKWRRNVLSEDLWVSSLVSKFPPSSKDIKFRTENSYSSESGLSEFRIPSPYLLSKPSYTLVSLGLSGRGPTYSKGTWLRHLSISSFFSEFTTQDFRLPTLSSSFSVYLRRRGCDEYRCTMSPLPTYVYGE